MNIVLAAILSGISNGSGTNFIYILSANEWGRLKMREWKMRHGHNCMGGKCRSGKCGSRLQGWKMQE